MKTFYLISGSSKFPIKAKTKKDAIQWVVDQLKPECKKAVRIVGDGYYYHSVFNQVI